MTTELPTILAKTISEKELADVRQGLASLGVTPDAMLVLSTGGHLSEDAPVAEGAHEVEGRVAARRSPTFSRMCLYHDGRRLVAEGQLGPRSVFGSLLTFLRSRGLSSEAAERIGSEVTGGRVLVVTQCESCGPATGDQVRGVLSREADDEPVELLSPRRSMPALSPA